MSTDRRATRAVSGSADLAFVEAVLDEVEALWASAPHVPSEDRAMFLLAVSEVVTNVVQHGPSQTSVHVELTVTPLEVVAVVRDTSTPVEVDWDSVAMPDDDAESGRGLALALAVLDELRHDASPAGNRWTLRRRLPAAGG